MNIVHLNKWLPKWIGSSTCTMNMYHKIFRLKSKPPGCTTVSSPKFTHSKMEMGGCAPFGLALVFIQVAGH
ncbi:MAG: hypothetical protein R2911_15840 [Caldilineaceae bacterium]